MDVVVALVAYIASGKSIVSEALSAQGYAIFSYGEEIAAEIERQNPGTVHTRDMRSDMAEYLRLTYGNDVLVRRLAAAIDAERSTGHAQKVVIDGLRHPDEIIFLRQHYPGLIVLGITIPGDSGDAIRYQWYLQRNRELDRPITPETFRRYDNRDRGVGEPPHGNHVDECLAMVDISLMNSNSKEELQSLLIATLQKNGVEK